MKPKHHSLTIDATYKLLEIWNKDNYRPDSVNLDKVYQRMNIGQPAVSGGLIIEREDLRRWVAYTDELNDVYVDGWLENTIIDYISNPTCFQHFAYGGKKAILQRGKSTKETVGRYDGYCWNNDTSVNHIFSRLTGKHSWISKLLYKIKPRLSLRSLNLSEVKYNLNWCIFAEDFFMKSPGYKEIKGSKEWDDQKYPSAIKMAKHYGEDVPRSIQKSSHRAIQSLGFAIHMLQDLCVPYHVLCDVSIEHSKFEDAALIAWEKDCCRPNHVDEIEVDGTILSRTIAPKVEAELETIHSASSFTELGEILVDETYQRIENNNNSIPKVEDETIKMTAQGIACAVKAVEMF